MPNIFSYGAICIVRLLFLQGADAELPPCWPEQAATECAVTPLSFGELQQLLDKKMLFFVKCPMPEGNRKAGLLLRVLGKALDLVVFLIALKTIPQVGALAGLVYVLISDGLFDGRSAGKKVLQLRVVGNESGQVCSFRESVLRNFPIACACGLYLVPMIGWLLGLVICGVEFLLMLGNRSGRRLGDELAGTLVIEDRAGSTAPASPGQQGDN